MGTITGQYIADNAWIKVNESTGGTAVRWPASEAVRWINNGQREIVNLSPRATAKSARLAITNTDTRQELASLGVTTAVQLLDVMRNISAANKPGRAITKRDRIWLDDQVPQWHSAPSQAEAVHWCYDDRDPNSFFIYPPITNGNKLELIYAAAPTDLANLTATIDLPDIYANALEFFVLFSFYSKDTTYTKNPQVAASYYQLFQSSALGRQAAIQANDQAGTQRAAG